MKTERHVDKSIRELGFLFDLSGELFPRSYLTFHQQVFSGEKAFVRKSLCQADFE